MTRGLTTLAMPRTLPPEAPRLPAVASVLACEAFIAALVVASEARHQLLGFRTGCVRRLGQEVLGVVPSERCCNAPMMEDLDVSILAASVGEAKVRWLGRGVGGHGVQRGFPVRPNAELTGATCQAARFGDGHCYLLVGLSRRRAKCQPSRIDAAHAQTSRTGAACEPSLSLN